MLGSDEQLNVNRMKALRKENSKYYGQIAELEGRENTYIDFEKENQKRAQEKEANRLKQSFGLKKKFNLRGGRKIKRGLRHSLNDANRGEEIALNEYEREQAELKWRADISR